MNAGSIDQASRKEIATKIWKKRDGEIALGLFKVGWPGERMTFAGLCDEFRSSHSSTLSVKSQRNHRMFSKNLRQFFGDHNTIEIHGRMVEESGMFDAASRRSATQRSLSKEQPSTGSSNVFSACSSSRSLGSTSPRAPLLVSGISMNGASAQQSEC